MIGLDKGHFPIITRRFSKIPMCTRSMLKITIRVMRLLEILKDHPRTSDSLRQTFDHTSFSSLTMYGKSSIN